MNRKSILFFVLIFILTFSMNSCSGKSIDEAFLNDMAKGLQARWDLVDMDEEDDKETTRQQFESFIGAELDAISEYKDKKFEDEKLGELASSYISLLEEGRSVTKYYESNYDRFWADYEPVYNERCKIIKKINEKYGIPMEDTYINELEDLCTNAELVEKVQNIIDSVEFEKVSDEYGWKDYEAVCENLCDTKFDYFSFNVNLEDGSGTVLEIQQAYTENWEPKAKHRFKFSTDADFDTISIVSAEYY